MMDNFTNMYYTGNVSGLDSTASGGHESSKNTWSDKVQRGRVQDEPDNSAGLIDQSPSGGPIGKEMQDAKQGEDAESREEYAHEAKRDFGKESQPQGLDPCGRRPDSREDAEDMLATRFVGGGNRGFEGGGPLGNGYP